MLISKAFNRKENKQPITFLVNIKQIIKIEEKKLTVFEPKHPLRGCYGTDAIPLSQTATFNIKCFKWDLKDSPICLDLAYFQPQNKIEKNLFGYLWVIFPFF